MTAHDHHSHVPGCFRCDLSRAEAEAQQAWDERYEDHIDDTDICDACNERHSGFHCNGSVDIDAILAVLPKYDDVESDFPSANLTPCGNPKCACATWSGVSHA